MRTPDRSVSTRSRDGAGGGRATGGARQSPITAPQARSAPTRARERKPALAALAVLLILGGALASGLLVIRSGHRAAVIVVAKPVAAGQRITVGDMRQGQISADGVASVPWNQRFQVAKYNAKVAMVPGTVLTSKMVSASHVRVSGKLAVGLSLKPGQVPSGGLRQGDEVRLYGLSDHSSSAAGRGGSVLAAQATVYQVTGTSTDDKLGTQSGETNVTVLVSPDEAGQVTEAASAGKVAVALIPPGSGVANTSGG